MQEKLRETTAYIQSIIKGQPEIGLVLGSGLGALADMLEDPCFIPYQDIPHFAVSTAPGHQGRLVLGRLAGKTLLCMQGRFHYYEGYTMAQVTYPVRVMKALGIETLILTNASGGMDPAFAPGDLMLITDHINYMGTNPLIGPNDEALGDRFPDMTEIYTKALREIAREAATAEGITLHEGVYVAFSGPCFETPAEIRMFRTLGGSAAGMSTVPEAIVASHSRMKVLAISCVTNAASGILDAPLTGGEVLEAANKAGADFTTLLSAIIARM